MKNRTKIVAAVAALMVAVVGSSMAQVATSTLPTEQTSTSTAWTRQVVADPLIPGAPFVTYVGDEAGNPILLLDAGLVPGLGEQHVVFRVPQVGLAGAGLFFRTGDTIICYYRPDDGQSGSLMGKPQWTVGRPHADVGEISWADNHTQLGKQQVDIGLGDKLPDLGISRRDDGSARSEAAAGTDRDVILHRPGAGLQRIPDGPANVIDLGQGGSGLVGGGSRAYLRSGGERTPPVKEFVTLGGNLGGGVRASLGTRSDNPVPGENDSLFRRPAPALLILHAPGGGGPIVGSGPALVLLVGQQLPTLR